MNERVKTKWLKALRSGEYKQTTGSLREKGNAFCCLGVLCDLYARETEGVSEYVKSGHGWCFKGKYGDRAGTILLSEVREWSGLLRPQEYDLITLNDARNWGFDRIADYIEKNL